MKRCSSCRRMLVESSFDKSKRTSDGLMVRCRNCNEAHKQHARTRYATDPEYRKTRAKYHKIKASEPGYLEDRAKHERKRYAQEEGYKKAKAEYHRQRADEPGYLDKRADHERDRYLSDQVYKSRKAVYRMEKYRSDPRIRVDNNISSQIRKSLNQGKSRQSWEKLVGYSLSDLIEHLEASFEDGMTWDNYGEWHIDHRTPRTWFKYQSPEDPAFKECWALSNLQPKWGRENIQKGNRFAD